MMQEFPPAPAGAVARTWLGIGLTVVTGVVAAVAASLFWLPHDLRYEIDAEYLRIHTRSALWSRTRVVALTDIEEARRVDLGRGRRRFGTAMPGYCVGTFHYPELGDVWEASDCSRRAVVVVVRGQARPLVLTPQPTGAFLAALEGHRPAVFQPPPVELASFWVLVKLAMLLPLLLVVIIPVLFHLAPARLRYAVGEGALVVRTLLRRRSFPVVGVLARRHQPRVGVKLVGSSLPGYHAGIFTVDGKRTRVYATRLDDGVVLEGDTRLFVSPQDADGFLALLRHEGARQEE
jgi:Bacterial PH domain